MANPHPPKLTLSIPEPLRSDMHIHATDAGRSVSKLVSEYFTALTTRTGFLLTGKASDLAKFHKAAAKAGLSLSDWFVRLGKGALK